MAADLVKDPTIKLTFVHDLESAFYVVFWLSIRFLPNSWSPDKRAQVMNEVFNPPTTSTVGPSSKKNWMGRAPEVINDFKIDRNPALTSLISSLVPYFQSRHVAIKSNNQPADHLKNYGPSNLRLSTVASETIGKLLDHLSNHQSVIETFGASLRDEWPQDEPAMKQEIGSFTGAGVGCSSKRSYFRKDSGKGSSLLKRSRTE